MIDLEQLRRAAESGDGESTVVSRRWLAAVLAELEECRATRAMRPGFAG